MRKRQDKSSCYLAKTLASQVKLSLPKSYRWPFVLGNCLCCAIAKVDLIYGFACASLKKTQPVLIFPLYIVCVH